MTTQLSAPPPTDMNSTSDIPGEPRDLRSALKKLTAAGEKIIRIARTVSPDRELSAVVKTLETRGNPIVLFESVKGSSMPVVVGVNGTRRRIAVALESSTSTLTESYLQRISRPLPPVRAATGPVKDRRFVGDEVDLRRLPIPTHAARDAGPYISSGVGLARDPTSGATNSGIYRMMVKGRNRLTVNADYSGDLYKIVHRAAQLGMNQEFVIVIGHHPALMIASQAALPIDEDSLAFTGAVLGEPLVMVPGETVGVDVPGWAEIVLEGHFVGTQREAEGPFGEFPYYYSSDQGFLFEVTAITHRKDAYYQDVHNVHPEHRNLWIVPNREAELLAKLRATFPTVHGCHIVAASGGLHAYFSIAQQVEGEAKRAIMLALASTPYLKQVVAVDPDINIWDVEEVIWALATRSQADRDMFLVPYCSGYGSDPSSYSIDSRRPRGGLSADHDAMALTTKVGIDATMPVQTPYAERADIVSTEFANLDLAAYVKNPEDLDPSRE